MEPINSETINQFLSKIQKAASIDLRECYQCGKCSAGCSTNWLMDYKPSQLIHLAQLGQKEIILTAEAIWFCTGCEICSARCPRNIDVARVMDLFREMAVKEIEDIVELDIPLFHQYFLKEIKNHGRLHELSLVANFKLHSHHPLSDFSMGPLLLSKGKIKLDFSYGKGVEDLKDMIELKI